MVDPLTCLRSWKHGYDKLDQAKKQHLKLGAQICIISMGLVFYFSPQKEVYAKREDMKKEVSFSVIDPWHRIGKGINEEQEQNFSKNGVLEKEACAFDPKFEEMLKGSPMEKMLEALGKQEKKVASYLIAIAKKESDWGKHSPKKSGKECYNYWGYKGGQQATVSGYSCFESPEQAVAIVGNRISDLLEKQINTPEKLVVWKCGSSCAGHDPQGVRKWIQDVTLYYNKLNS